MRRLMPFPPLAAVVAMLAPPAVAASSGHVDFRDYSATSVKAFVEDKANFTQANCDNDFYAKECTVHATVTLSARTAKAAHLTKRRIADLDVPLTTKAEQDAAHTHQGETAPAGPGQARSDCASRPR